MNIETFDLKDKQSVIDLWDRCGLLTDKNNPGEDIIRKMDHSPELFLIGRENEKIIATIMGGYEGRRGWINFLCVSPDARRSGYGERMVREIENRLFALGAPKINLQIRHSNAAAIKFYEAIGYADDLVFSMARHKN